MNRIRQLRKDKKLTLKEAAEQLTNFGLPITIDKLSKYERGKREPKLKTWQKLAEFFEVPVTYIQGISNVSNEDDFNHFEKWFKDVATPVLPNSDKVGIPTNELHIYLQKQEISKFKQLVKLIYNFNTNKNEKYDKLVDQLTDKDLDTVVQINWFITESFKVAINALSGDKAAKKIYKEMYSILDNYKKSK